VTTLPPLRQELRLDRGAPLASGTPGYILFDPLRHLFFQLGRLEQRVATHWRRGDPHAIHAALVAEGTDPADAEHAIAAFYDFARVNGLVAGASVADLAARHTAAKRDWWRWLLDHYLFVRVPLVRPAAFLARTLPAARLIWSPTGIAALVALALTGLLLVSGQWDAFTAQLGDLMTPGGIAAYAVALLFVKAFHELGHAWTATRYGVRVPAMGVSLLVLVPVLYTDTSGAWRLRARRQRMAIDAAGVLAELSVAAVALFLWPFLPDGPVRTIAFIVATTSLATSLLVNASPFMRFDGYYLLADWLRVPNLAPRAFALMRWRLREALFGLGEPAPEPLSRGLSCGLLAYAVVTFCYRTALYVGIALLVYHSVFKALGIILFAVEVYVFLARPVVAELREWRIRLPAIAASRRTRWTAGVAAALVLAAFLPLDRSVSLPAVMTPIADQPLSPGDPAEVVRILVVNGDAVHAGQPLVELAAPDLALGIAQAQLRIATLQSRIARGVADRDDLAAATVLARDLATERDRLAGFERRRAALTLRAAVDGRVVDLDPDLAPGRWTDGRRPLLRVVAPDRFDVQAYLPEDQGWRVSPGTQGRFVASGLSTAAAAVRLDEVGAGAVDTLAQPILAATNGGPIATTDRTLRPAHAVVALRLVAERQNGQGFVQPVAGRVVLPAKGDSLAADIARAIGRVFARETAF
jgi:putative peptide zinc metalloprotease protein